MNATTQDGFGWILYSYNVTDRAFPRISISPCTHVLETNTIIVVAHDSSYLTVRYLRFVSFLADLHHKLGSPPARARSWPVSLLTVGPPAPISFHIATLTRDLGPLSILMLNGAEHVSPGFQMPSVSSKNPIAYVVEVDAHTHAHAHAHVYPHAHRVPIQDLRMTTKRGPLLSQDQKHVRRPEM